jgi:Bacterial PH domain
VSTNLIKIRTLPDGERLLWQGSPAWRGLALRAFHVKSVILYFGALLALHAATSWWSGEDLAGTVKSGVWLLIPMVTGPALLALFAWLTSRTTHYTITNRRVLMRFGIALPITLNIPFRQVTSAALKSYSDGTGDIPLATDGKDRLAYILLWPHVRPWHFKSTEPMLRAVPDAAHVAEILAAALESASTISAPQMETTGKESPAPSFAPAAAAA